MEGRRASTTLCSLGQEIKRAVSIETPLFVPALSDNNLLIEFIIGPGIIDRAEPVHQHSRFIAQHPGVMAGGEV